MNAYRVILLLLFAAWLVPQHTRATEDLDIDHLFGVDENIDEELDFFDNFSLDEPEEFDPTDILSHLSRLEDGLSPEDICNALEIAGLTQTFTTNFVPLLELDLFCRSNPLRKRNLLGLPTFQSFKPCTDHWELKGHLFYNEMKTNIAPYFAFNNQTLLSNIQQLQMDLGDLIQDVGQADIEEVLEVANQAIIHQRQTGFLVNAQRNWRRLYFGLRGAVLYFERNYDAPGEPEFPDDFIYRNLVSDKLGVSDVRLWVGGRAWQGCKTTWDLGLEITTPTAAVFTRGIAAHFNDVCGPCVGKFPVRNYRPNVDFETIVNEALCGNTQAAVAPLLNALHQLNALFLDASMGNDKHFSFGGFVHPTYYINENLMLRSRLAFEYLIPKDEHRYFICNRDLSGFNDRDFADCDQADDNYEFLTQQFLDMLFFNLQQPQVKPGVIGQFLTQLEYTRNRFCGYIGLEAWVQAEEEFNNACDCPISSNCLNLRISSGTKKRATQGRIFGGLTYIHPGESRDFYFSLNAEKSLWKSNIGKAFLVSFAVGTTV